MHTPTKGIFIFPEFPLPPHDDVTRSDAVEILVRVWLRVSENNKFVYSIREPGIWTPYNVIALTPFQAGTFSVSVPDTPPPSEAYDRFARQWRSQASTKWNGGCSAQRDPSTVDIHVNIYTRRSIV